MKQSNQVGDAVLHLLTVGCANSSEDLGGEDDLEGCEEDCRELAEVFDQAASFGFSRTEHTHLSTQSAIWPTVLEWTEGLPDRADALAYFSLHGTEDRKLCLYDQQVAVEDVRCALAQQTEHCTLVVDACHIGSEHDVMMLPAGVDTDQGAPIFAQPELPKLQTGATLRVRRPKASNAGKQSGEPPSQQASSCAVLTSSGHHQYSLETEFAGEATLRGVFTKLLCHSAKHYPGAKLEEHHVNISRGIAAYGNLAKFEDDDGQLIFPYLNASMSHKTFCKES